MHYYIFNHLICLSSCLEAAKEDEAEDDDDMNGLQTDEDDDEDDGSDKEMGDDAEEGDEADSTRLQKLAAQVITLNCALNYVCSQLLVSVLLMLHSVCIICGRVGSFVTCCFVVN